MLPQNRQTNFFKAKMSIFSKSHFSHHYFSLKIKQNNTRGYALALWVFIESYFVCPHPFKLLIGDSYLNLFKYLIEDIKSN